MLARTLTSFRFKNPGKVQGLERVLGHGQGARIQFYDRPGVPFDWDAPFVFYVNGTDVGYLLDDTLKIDLGRLKNTQSDVLEKVLGIADQIENA